MPTSSTLLGVKVIDQLPERGRPFSTDVQLVASHPSLLATASDPNANTLAGRWRDIS
jgi:hypothetical protein